MSQLTLEHACFPAAVYTFSSKTHIQAMDLEKTQICLSQKLKALFFFYFLFLRIMIFLKQRGSEVIKNTLLQIIFSNLAFHQVVLLGTNLLRLIRVICYKEQRSLARWLLWQKEMPANHGQLEKNMALPAVHGRTQQGGTWPSAAVRPPWSPENLCEKNKGRMVC